MADAHDKPAPRLAKGPSSHEDIVEHLTRSKSRCLLRQIGAQLRYLRKLARRMEADTADLGVGQRVLYAWEVEDTVSAVQTLVKELKQAVRG